MNDNFIFHDSYSERFRSPFGAACCGSIVKIRIETNTQLPVRNVYLKLVKEDGDIESIVMQQEERHEQMTLFGAQIRVTDELGLLWYFFKLNIDGADYYYGNNHNAYGGIGKISYSIPVYYQITVYKKSIVPKWYKNAVMYQIFVDRFYNGNSDGKVLNPRKNIFLYGSWDDAPTYIKDCETGGIHRWDFFGGNLEGVIQKLDYIKELGANVIYFNPVFESPSNHKYDTADYKKIDSMFGDNETFRMLCRRASERGISVILDGVFSHTGSDSIYFNRYNNYKSLGAYQSKDSPYYSWYRFTNHPNEYEAWWGIDNMPNVEEMNEAYRDFIIKNEDSVIKYWMKLGAKGWRLDVADELPDEFIKELKQYMKQQDPESILIGEVWEDASNKISYGKRRRYLQGEELDSVMNYPFRDNLLSFLLEKQDAQQFNNAIMSLKENYPPENFYANMNVIGTHDVPRVLTILGEAPLEDTMSTVQKQYYKLSFEMRQLAIARLKLAVLMQMTFPGVPCIYYGDEAGVEGYKDPLNRSTYPWGNENSELLEWYKALIKIRNKYTFLREGKFIPIYAKDNIYAYLRAADTDAGCNDHNNSAALVIINRSKTDSSVINIDIGKWINKEYISDILDSKQVYDINNGLLRISLQELSAKILI